MEENELKFVYEYMEMRLGEIERDLRQLEANGWPQPETEIFRTGALAIQEFAKGLIQHVKQRRDRDIDAAISALKSFTTRS